VFYCYFDYKQLTRRVFVSAELDDDKNKTFLFTSRSLSINTFITYNKYT